VLPSDRTPVAAAARAARSLSGAGSAQQAPRVPHAEERCAETFPAHYLWQFYRFLLSYLHFFYLYFYPVARVFAVSVAT
jgi:hypothetical protein